MKYILLAAFLVRTTLPAQACDFCNCYLGLNPHFKKNSVGLRYHVTRYRGTHHDLSAFAGAGLTASDFRETRTQYELYGQWYPTQKLQVNVSLVYGYNREVEPAGAQAAIDGHTHTHGHGDVATDDPGTAHGPGDPLVVVQYQVFNRTAADSGGFSQRLFAGGGLQLPFGQYRPADVEDVTAFAHQPGTGGTGFLVNTSYLAKAGRFGFNINGSWKYATTNDLDYRFGNSFNVNALVYYQVGRDRRSLYPSVGAFYEQAGRDTFREMTVSNSGGSVLYLHAGCDGYLGRLALHAAFQWPAALSLHMPQAEVRSRLIAGISYAID